VADLACPPVSPLINALRLMRRQLVQRRLKQHSSCLELAVLHTGPAVMQAYPGAHLFVIPIQSLSRALTCTALTPPGPPAACAHAR